jgi:hypothetical protein
MTKMVGAFMKIYLGLVIKTDSLRLFTLSAGSTRVPLKMAIDLNFEVGEYLTLMHYRDLPFPLKPWWAPIIIIMTLTFLLHLKT